MAYYGEQFGIGTLSKVLKNLASDIYDDIDNGEDYEDITDKAENLMEGSIELWKRLMEYSYED